MIVTLTPNPSLDRSMEVSHLERGAVLRSSRALVHAGGKGINVVQALAANGVTAAAVLPIGGPEGAQLLDLLTADGIQFRTTPIAGTIRANISIVEPDGTVTKINEPGPHLTDDEVGLLLTATADAATGAAWVVACGSLPDGAPVDLYARIVEQAHEAGARVAVDTSGAPLLACLPAGPDLIKPNADELAAAAGTHITTLGDVVAAADALRTLGAGAVLASLGADGAVLLTDSVRLHATCPVDRPVSAVGAGDAALAGYLTGATPAEGLRAAVAFGAAAVQLPGSALPGPADIDLAAVRVTEAIDHDVPLTERNQTDDARLRVR